MVSFHFYHMHLLNPSHLQHYLKIQWVHILMMQLKYRQYQRQQACVYTRSERRQVIFDSQPNFWIQQIQDFFLYILSLLIYQEKMRPSKQTTLDKKAQPSETKNIPVKLREVIRNKVGPSAIDERISRKKQCLICKQHWPVSEIDHLKCQHEFCYECLHCYVNYRCLVGLELKCPCCDKLMEGGAWRQRCDEQLTAEIELISDQKDLKTNKLCLQGVEEKCYGIVDLKGARFQCKQCKTQFCFQCYLPKHQGLCKDKYLELQSEWKRCPQCNLFRQPTQTCTHFSCELQQKYCLVCLAGWSDRYSHQCSKEIDPLPKQVWLRESIMSSSWYLNILRGILMALGFPLFFGIVTATLLLLHALAVGIAVLVTPIMAFSQSCPRREYVASLLFILCFPCGQIIGIAAINHSLWQQYTSMLPGTIVTYILTNKSLFYYTLPYRQKPSNYTSFEVRSTPRRVVYLIIMILLLPFMIVLPVIFFLMSAMCVFVFTLLSLPVVAMKVKGIPVWVSLLFFPIVFFHFISLDYISKFLVGQTKQLGNFYKYYFLTMFRYITCQDNAEDNSCAEPLDHARLPRSDG